MTGTQAASTSSPTSQRVQLKARNARINAADIPMQTHNRGKGTAWSARKCLYNDFIIERGSFSLFYCTHLATLRTYHFYRIVRRPPKLHLQYAGRRSCPNVEETGSLHL